MLEYCDWGCLRDALDAGAFFSGGSLNYAAILDTAADVAKAMLHLHCNQVCVWVQLPCCFGPGAGHLLKYGCVAALIGVKLCLEPPAVGFTRLLCVVKAMLHLHCHQVGTAQRAACSCGCMRLVMPHTRPEAGWTSLVTLESHYGVGAVV